MRTPLILLSLGVALALAGAVDARPAQTVGLAAPLPAGWASGGTAANPESQVTADTTCGDNSVLLFSARGSGDVYGGDLAHNKIGAWTQGAGNVVIKAGWNARDLQAIYPAPAVPSFPKLAAAARVGGAPGVALVLKNYRDAATNSWKSVRAELEAAYNRCPTRPILLAGYSQGAILLRYIVPRLPADVLVRIVSVDLIADPTEQRTVDTGLQHPAKLDGFLSDEGIDTFAGLTEHAGSFQQTAYPSTIQTGVYQYCMSDDLVCNLDSQNLEITNAANEGAIHASYAFETIGITAGRRLGSFAVGWRLPTAAEYQAMSRARDAVKQAAPADICRYVAFAPRISRTDPRYASVGLVCDAGGWRLFLRRSTATSLDFAPARDIGPWGDENTPAPDPCAAGALGVIQHELEPHCALQ